MEEQYSDTNVDITPITLEVSGFKPSIDKDLLEMYFENSRRSGGGEMEEFHMSPSKRSATIIFKDDSVTKRVLKKSHTLEGAVLTFVEKKDIKEELMDEDLPDENKNDNIQDKAEQVEMMIEVSGINPSTDEETLTMYFENIRKSGGGDIKDMQIDASKRQATITFINDSVIKRVLKNSHRLNGAELTVVETKPRPPRPIDSHRIFLKGVPEDIHQETFMLFIENRTSISEDPSVIYGEKPGTVMLYYAVEIPDLDSVVQKFSKKKLKGSYLTAECVKATDCILVQGLKTNTSKDVIELYFENSRKSGGGTVTDVKYYEEENKATVTFEDWTVVNKVSERDKHVLIGSRLSVTAHHECLGTAVSSDGPIPVIPKPIPYSVDRELIEHIMDKHQAKLVGYMKQSKIEITWPHNGDRSQTLLNPIPTKSADRDMWRTWTDTATKDFTQFLETFLKESIPIPVTIWSDLSDMISDMEAPNITVLQRADKSIITLIGTSADVNATKAVLSGIVQDLKTQAEKEAQTIEKKHPLSALKMTLFTTFDILNELNKQFPNVDITVLSSENAIGFKGMRGEITESRVALYGIFESLRSVNFEADPSIRQFIDRFCDTINGILLSKGLTALCHIEDGKIYVYGRSSADTQAAMEWLYKDITCKQMPIDKDTTMNALLTEKGIDKIKTLNNNEVVVQIDPSKRHIKIAGLADKVEKAAAEIGTFLDENVIIMKFVSYPPLHLKYLRENCGTELFNVGKQGVKMYPKFNGRQSGFTLRGKEKSVDSAITLMEKLKSKIVDRQHKVDKPGMLEVLRAPNGTLILQSLAHKHDCLIETNNMDTYKSEDDGAGSNPKEKASETLCHYTTTCGCKSRVCKGDLTKENVDDIVNAPNVRLDHIGGLARAIAVADPANEPDESDASFTSVPDAASVGYSEIKIGSVTVQLQQGDLVKENVDAIVNTVATDFALIGVVSRALVKAGGKVITDECSQIRKASPSVPHIAKTSAGKLPSKHIIHVALTGPDKVKKMAKEILQLAEMDGIQSIAFPALGTGNLGGTAQQVAPELINAICKFATTEKPKNVQLVKLVIFQQDMIPVFEAALKKNSKKPDSALMRRIKTIGDLLKIGSRGGSKATDDRKPANKIHDMNDDSMTLYIVARDRRKLDEVVTAIEELIIGEFYSEEILPEGADLTETVIGWIRAIARKHKVKAAVMTEKKGVLLEGAQNSVLHAKSDILAHFARIQADERRIVEDRLISKEVQWRYKTSSGIYDNYYIEINAVIERAYRDKDKKSFVELDLKDEQIRIDFVKMVEIDVSGVKPDAELHRVDLKAATLNPVPNSWAPMAATENFKIVTLTPGSPEYRQVETTFKGGVYQPSAIVKIERIQNKEMYIQYTARKDQMKARLGRDTELTMYHGTSQETVDKINKRGFNRSFCGKNAVRFGKGTYFTRDLSYSAQDRFSTRDANGHKSIYMCKVLVGDCIKGDKTMIEPPQKPHSADIYDSTVNDVNTLDTVVIYHDAQTYPEFLITFQ